MSRKCLLREIVEKFERYEMFVLGHQSAYVMNWMMMWKMKSKTGRGRRELIDGGGTEVRRQRFKGKKKKSIYGSDLASCCELKLLSL